MNKIDELQKQLSRVFHGINALGFHSELNETKRHVQLAMAGLTKFNESRATKEASKNKRFDEYWGNIQAGAVAASHSPTSPNAIMKSLQVLDNMIKAEQDKLTELERKTEDDGEETTLLG